MTVVRFPQEPLPENKSRLNQQSKSALKQLKVSADPYYLYSLQLAEAALEKGMFLANSPCTLLDQVQGMYGWAPADAQRFLERNAQDDENEIYPNAKLRSDPEALADAILQGIEHKLSLRTGYPTLPRS